MMRKYPVLLFTLGLLLGLGLSVGALYGARAFVPDFWTRAIDFFAIEATKSGAGGGSPANIVDSSFVKGIVQDILTSDQTKAIVSEMVRDQSNDTFQTFFREALENPDVRKALKDALHDFLTSDDGKAILTQIIQDLWIGQ